MSQLLFRTGDRVRLSVPTWSGWLGEAVVTHDEPLDALTVSFLKVEPADAANPTGHAHWSALERITEGPHDHPRTAA